MTRPIVVVPNRIIRNIIAETELHPATETGQSITGLEVGREYIVVLATVPDFVDVTRNPGETGLGGQSQQEINRWNKAHWKLMVEKSQGFNLDWNPTVKIPKGLVPPKLQVPWAYLGDWHKHPPNFNMLSQHDLNTISSIYRDTSQHRDQLLLPLVTYRQAEKFEISFEGDQMVIPVGRKLWISWYYSCREDPTPVRIEPVVVGDDFVPWLPPLGWHLTNISRMRMELSFLYQEGWVYRWSVRQMDPTDPEMEIVFGIDCARWKKNRVLVTTKWNYPEVKPKVQLLPKNGVTPPTPPAPSTTFIPWKAMMDWFSKLLYGQPRDLYEPISVIRAPWDKGAYIVDLVKNLETEGKL